MMGLVVAFAIASYLLGSIPFGLLAGRLLKGVDIRDFGSGKTGMTNTLRTLGRGPAVAVFLMDMLKGVIPVLVAKLVSDDARLQVVGALAAIAGHDWPVYAGFRGGRGVSSSFGATLAMMPLLGIFVPFIGGVVLFPFRYVSLMSVVGTVVTAGIVLALSATNRVPGAYAVFAVVAATLIVVLHRDNIGRLLAGTEPKIGQGGEKRAPPKKYAPGGGRPR
jgi:glycerol-3-phosphate acyltransferase PlsY